MTRPLLLAIPIAVSFATVVQAQPVGWRAAAIGGLERTDAAPGTGARDGAYYGAQLGYDWRAGPLLAGAEGDIGGSTARADLPGRRAAQGVFLSLAARVALPIGERQRVFVRGGYAYHAVTYSTGPAFRGSGFTAGGGAERDIGRRLFLRAEYRYSDYGRTVRGQHFIGGIGVRF